jgi:hypothetical protein
MFIETSAKAGHNVIKRNWLGFLWFRGSILNLVILQVKTLFRKIAQALPGMDNTVGDVAKDQSKSIYNCLLLDW